MTKLIEIASSIQSRAVAFSAGGRRRKKIALTADREGSWECQLESLSGTMSIGAFVQRKLNGWRLDDPRGSADDHAAHCHGL